MADSARDRPHANSNFLVEIGGASGRSAAAGFAEVVFAPFAIGGATDTRPGANAPGADSEPVANRLLLRRGATGALDLYAWWDQARRGKTPPRRVVRVRLLAEDRATVVMTWRFRNVRPLSLSYSPLQAMDGGVLMETLELAFDDVEMS